MISGIENLQFELDVLAPAGRIGVIALATDFNIESDLNQLYPKDVQYFTSRVRNNNPLTINNLRKMESGITACADTILPGTELDVVIYACTSGTIAIGRERITQLINQSRPNTAVTDPVTAALLAFDSLQAKRISVLTPYTEAVNQDVAKFFTSQGIEVVSIAGFGFEDDTAMTFISLEDIKQTALKVCAPDADLLFISCTALRAASAIELIESQLGKPVLSSNQVLAWHSLQLMNYPSPIKGFGVLLEQCLPLVRHQPNESLSENSRKEGSH
ncbi:AroM family protein [Vibrio brasiliensis]|uniref:maleate cis-trans isomerase family protein n=1 Tax=Vibrio oreintalis group TaxID=1891919 RepID=UPI001EFE8128|nr:MULTISPECIES: AroM family protein [Vibrio oreintalis group]MCG9579589.1 AroM family protein [Vibrio tubiashii]MCG9753137.1 AroM family protein [Vibrio brasiliensis]